MKPLRRLSFMLFLFVSMLLNGQDNSLYVTYSKNASGPDSILLLEIQGDGQLTEVERYATGGAGYINNANVGITVDKKKGRLFTTNSMSHDISSFNIGEDGKLSAVSGSPFAAYYDSPAFVGIHNNGNFAYVSHSAGLSYYGVDENGALSFIDTLEAVEYYREMVFHPDSNWLYVTSMSAGVYALYANPTTGQLTTIDTLYTYPARNRTYRIRINSIGDTLFVSDLDVGVSVFEIQSDGSLEIIGDSPYSVGTFSTGFAVSADDQYTFTGVSSGGIVGHGVNSNPFMQKIFATSRIASGYFKGLVNPEGTDLLYCIDNNNEISVLTINGASSPTETVFSPLQLNIDPNYAFSSIIYPGEGADLTNTAVDDQPQYRPKSFTLLQNYPNPFNPTTTIEYNISRPGLVQLQIFNMKGQEVRTLVNGTETAGNKAVNWDGRNNSGNQLPSGTYIYRLIAGDKTLVKKMLLLK